MDLIYTQCMLRVFGYLLANVLVLFLLSAVIPEFEVTNIWAATGFVLLLTLLNWTVVPIIKLLAWPINLVTLGLFNGIINLIFIAVSINLVDGINISANASRGLQFLIILFISIGLSLAQSVVDRLTKSHHA